jgi:hypothetical protein
MANLLETETYATLRPTSGKITLFGSGYAGLGNRYAIISLVLNFKACEPRPGFTISRHYGLPAGGRVPSTKEDGTP